jgi:pyruvate dehydrogenase E1 component beta subunit
VVVHEAPRSVGVGAEIVAQLQERCLYDLQSPIARVTGWDIAVPLKMAEHHYQPSTDRIIETVNRMLAS